MMISHQNRSAAPLFQVGLEFSEDGLAKARQYLSIVKDYPPSPPLSTLIFHSRRMAKMELTQFQLLEDFKAAKSLDEVHDLLRKAEGFRDAPGSFQANKEKEKKDRELRKQQAGAC